MNNNRDTAFVPLSTDPAAPRQNAEVKLTVLPQPGNVQPFRPLGHPATLAAAALHDSACEPRISIQREGDRVSSIQVQCSCGQLIELACVY
jgi:hypothetical protein